MNSKDIVEVWKNTIDIFNKYNVPISEKKLNEIVHGSVLPILLTELNTFVGSSATTCIEGG